MSDTNSMTAATAISPGLHTSDLQGLKKIYNGKVRDIYAVGDDHLLIIASDRVSAYDVILPSVIPGKGQLLTSIALFWFDQMKDLVPNHLSDLKLEDVLESEDDLAQARGRSMLVKKLEGLPIEAVVRGYLIGSGWRDYESTGEVCGIKLPSGLEIASELPELLFTPATKAAAGEHDENISFEEVERLIGKTRASEVRETTLKIYQRARAFAKERGIIIADTKFEFGIDNAGKLTLMDEILTPDSSRFWPAEDWKPGVNPASFDKQFVRDYLDTLDWDKTAPGPELPEAIITETRARYVTARDTLTGLK